MERLIIYFLPIILALGIITSYEDSKEGKIRNKYVVTAALTGIVLHCILASISLESITQIKTQAAITVLALITGVFIWRVKWWSAGDAKLFTAYALLFPAITLNNTGMVFPVMVLLATMVIPIWVVLFIRALATHPRKILTAFKMALRPKDIFSSLLLILSVPWLITLVLSFFGFRSNFLISMAGIVLISSLTEKRVPKKIMLAIYGVVVLTRAVLATRSLLSLEMLLGSAAMLLVYIILRYFAMALMFRKMASKPKDIKKNRWFGFWSTYTDTEVPFAPIMFFGVLLTIVLAITGVV